MKKYYQSRTIWYNTVTVLAVIVAVLGQYGVVPDADAITKATEINTMLAPLVNIFLRSITNKGLTT